MKKLCHLSNNILIVSISLIVLCHPGAFQDCYRGKSRLYLRIAPEMTVLSGSCVEIECNIRQEDGYLYHPNYVVLMKHKPIHGVGSSYVIFNSSGSINTHQVEMTGDLQRHNCSVRIPDLTEDHDDKYFFRIEYTDIKATFCDSPIKLTVIDSPWIPIIDIRRVDPDDMREHQSASITCTVENRCAPQQPELIWNIKVRNSVIFKEYDGSFLAYIRNDNFTLSDKHDGFNISCSPRYPVKGGFKQAVAIMTLNVSYAPKDTSASFSPSGLLSPGSRVELSCSSRAKPPPRFTWFRNTERGKVKVSEKQIFNTTEPGEYYCEVTNELGSVKSKSICPGLIDASLTPSINVPSDLKEHQSVTVTCSAFTPCPHSPPELTWTLQQDSLNQTEKNTERTFTTKIQENITLSDTHDGYNIRCSARYPVIGGNKTAETEVTLSVSYAPKDTSASFSPSGLVSAGSWVELSCSSRAKPPPRFTWFKNTRRGEVKVSEKQIFNATEPGEYYCEATNELGSEKSKSICPGLIDASLTPSINVPSDLKEHQSVTVTCSAFTPCPHSPPELTWTLQQDSLRQTEKNTERTFTTKIQENITLSDTHDGYNIRCSARYPVIGGSKTAETEVTLSVSYAPKATSASISPSGLVSAGSWVELSCSSRAKPPPRFTWFWNSKHGATNVSVGQVYSFNATERGEYYCVATNKLGSEKSEGTCLDLIDASLTPSINVPSDLKEHQFVTVTCSVSTPCPHSPPELTWNLQQDSLRQTEKNTDGTFTTKIQKNITLSDTHDGYNISCSARYPVTDKSDIAETEVTLSVSYAPKDTSASIRPSGLVPEDSWVDLSCYSRAKPPPKITWFKNSNQGPIKVSEKEVYGFSATPTEEGDYYCEATNELGSEKSTSICIDISDPTLTPRINISAGNLKEHQSVTVTCSAFTSCPHSPLELTWNLKKGSLRQIENNADGTFTTKIQETITLSHQHDGYIIRCFTRNPAAEISDIAKTEVTLSVSYAPRNTSASISPSGLVSEGSWVELNCSSKANPPPRITWFKKGPERLTKAATGIFHKVKFTQGDQYYCVASNKLGKQKSSPINLRTKGTNGVGAWIFVVIGGVGMVVLGGAVFVIDSCINPS